MQRLRFISSVGLCVFSLTVASLSLLYPPPVDITFVRDFLRNELAALASPVLRQLILGHFLVQFSDTSIQDDARVYHLRELVIPVLRSALMSEDAIRNDILRGPVPQYLASKVRLPERAVSPAKLGDGSSADAIVESPDGAVAVASPPSEAPRSPPSLQRLFMDVIMSGDTHTGRVDQLNTELLTVSTMFIHFQHAELLEHRKHLIKFAWAHLKSEDALLKHAAHVNVCRFIEVRNVVRDVSLFCDDLCCDA